MLSHEALDNRFNKNALFITAFVQIKRLRRMGEDGFFFCFFLFSGRQGDESETASGQEALARQ